MSLTLRIRQSREQLSDPRRGVRRHDEAEKRLPKASLVLLSKFEPVLQWTKHCDNVLYQGLVEILIPDVLRPIPSECTAAVPCPPLPVPHPSVLISSHCHPQVP